MIREYLKLSSNPILRLYLVTAGIDSATAIKAKELGVVVLLKPVPVADMVKAVRQE
jgi:hypothetical protein